MGTPTAATAAVNRFGLGARPGDFDGLGDPRGWLTRQVATGADGAQLFAGLPTSLEYLARESEYRLKRRELRQQMDPKRRALLGGTPGDGDATGNGAETMGQVTGASSPVNAQLRAGKQAKKQLGFGREFRGDLLREASARYRLAAVTDTPFMERLVQFWSNHFAVSIDKGPARLYAAPMEREAIRPHLLGRFADMLLAVETHPAMLRYLDNVQSIGPDSRVGERIAERLQTKGTSGKGKAGGLNENLGREIMELHTLGVNGGYTQADVTEFARAITGWSTPLPRDFSGSRLGAGTPGSAFVFRAYAHEPGARTVLGKRYAEGGFEQGRAILLDLARHPATAKHVSFQLARHFVADDPPPALVARMARSWLEHDTDLAAVYRTLIESPEAWAADARKFKSPQDFVISTLRAGRIDVGDNPRPVLALLNTLGEPAFTPRSPAGFPDTAADWIDADALWKRVQAAEALSERISEVGLHPNVIAQSVLGPMLDAETGTAIRRAESPQQGMATLFASPAFQWRV